ncbi:o-succinylbenzoate--CoA ligase [Vibrio sp. JC009]|uniref:o-succinylbenzoate--CoA ligase n=1 Tax=Vibrio sp. JC009 TaxID=2912314 RepID=UPI0023B20535|nr:o-succinylbenzoate--CoA ligase [Vibrio sp. JC009]WED22613.1 o-succinylbenzoate--CoA ligase [Vibrio sp. JC009]
MAVVESQAPKWRQWAQQSPLSYALITAEKSYNWQSLCEEVSKCITLLEAQGVQSGDVVTLVGKNHPSMLILFLACQELGAVAAFMMPQPMPVLISKLNILYADKGRVRIWLTEKVRRGYSDSELSIVRSSLLKYEIGSGFGTELPVIEHDYSAEKLATIVFTSGSTGVPKAVAHTSVQHFASAAGLLERFHFTAGDTWLLSLPMYHVSGLAIVYRWLHAGACLKVGAGNLSEDISGVTHASLVATQLKRLLDSGEPLALNHVLLGGSHIPAELGRRAEAIGIEAWVGYGMTEAASTVTAKRVDDALTAGRVLPKRKLKLERQRIFIKGDTIAQGYYKRGNLTPVSQEDGWFDTKDLGEWERDELKVIGRADNLFISGGENIHCEEIEVSICKHPQVSQAIVIPVENEEFGYRPVAIIQSDVPVAELELKQWLTDKLIKFKIPDAFFDMPDIKSGTIKVSRAALKEWFESEVQNR